MKAELITLRVLLYLSLAASLFALLGYEGGRNATVSGTGAITFVVALAGLACSAQRP